MSFRPLAFLSLLALTSCLFNPEPARVEGGKASPAGYWSGTRALADSAGKPGVARYELNLEKDSTAKLELFWEEQFALGLDGRWSLRSDSVVLDVERCWRGVSGEAREEAACGEGIPARLSLAWDGAELRFDF